MASTSTQKEFESSPSNLGWTYDVFLSFRGEDTRDNFTDHLYADLVRKGIRTFRDDQLRRGENIGPELLNAIEKSRSSIVVFSKTYADSRWCLDELAKIMECRREYMQIVLPIFYHADPSDVRKQTGSFGEAFTRYEENWKNKVQIWREALTEAGNISGWHVEDGYESEHIKKITTTVADRILGRKLLFVGDNLVGMDSHFKKISLELSLESDKVRMVGICGIGGIGKTTIAAYIYNQIFWEFECVSFLHKVKEVYKKKGLLRLQNQLLNDILEGRKHRINDIHQGAKVIQNSLSLRKALIVFDDVDDVVELEFLIGKHDWYGKGSRIIITTRDKQCLTKLNVDYLYEVEGLDSNEALKLCSQHAFQPNLPREDFKNLLDHVIDYCQGLPLALKVLGSFLCGKTIHEWESELHKLEKEPEMRIQNVLKISFDELDNTQKMILLDTACFFQGEDKDFASKIWDGCELYSEVNIRVLLDRCLITISDNKICMHGLIEKMCKKIVREQHPRDPSKWSRLWNPNDIRHAFESEEGMQNVETISLDLSRSKEIWFSTKIFAQMKNVFAQMNKLRLLKVYYSDGNEIKMPLPKGFEFPPNLNYLHWEGLMSLPSNFHGENLVAITLKSSNIRELLKGEKCLAGLKFIDLTNSQQLTKIPEFSRMPKLEKLNLRGCISFSQFHSSIGTFSTMKFSMMKFLGRLNFSGSGIRELSSSIGSLISLETLDLSNCSKFEKFLDGIFVNMRKLRELKLRRSGIKALPTSIGYLESLELIDLSFCFNFEKFPEIQGNMKHLKTLYLRRSAIKELPTSIERLEALEYLYLAGCSNFEKFPEIQKNMENLRTLDLRNTAIKELPYSISHFIRLGNLDLNGTKNLTSLPSSIFQSKFLHSCYIGCPNLEIFPEIMEDMENLTALEMTGLAIAELPSSFGRLKSLYDLRIRDCPKLQKLPDSLRSLQHCLIVLDVGGCNLMEGAIPSDLWCLYSLKWLNVSENNICRIPVGIIQLSQLHTLRMNHCPMLEEIPELPSNLRRIQAHGCPRLETSLSDAMHSFLPSLLNRFKVYEHAIFSSDDIDTIFSGYEIDTTIVTPGSIGIPEWISHKSMGHEITIHLPKNWYEDNNFLGFALFCHHVPLDDDDNDTCKTIYDDDCLIPIETLLFELLISDGDQFEQVWSQSHASRHQHLDYDNYYCSNTSSPEPSLRVTYFPWTAIIDKHRSNGWNKFKASFKGYYSNGAKRAFKVESCGIHLTYAEDHPYQSLELCSVKRSHDDTKGHPHHKRLKHV